MALYWVICHSSEEDRDGETFEGTIAFQVSTDTELNAIAKATLHAQSKGIRTSQHRVYPATVVNMRTVP